MTVDLGFQGYMWHCVKIGKKKFWFRDPGKQVRNQDVAKPWSFGQSHKGFWKSVSSLINENHTKDFFLHV